jgi:ammonium transporter, Amt family
MSDVLFDECAFATDDNSALLHCISKQFSVLEMNRQQDTANTAEWLLIFCGALVLMMQTGFAMVCAGAVRKKNLQNTMLKNLLDTVGASLAFWLCGYAFAFGGDGDSPEDHQHTAAYKTFVGTEEFFLYETEKHSFYFIQFCYAASCSTIIAGTIAERCKMSAYFWYSFLIAGLVYPVVAHAIWSNHGVFSAYAEDPFRGVGVIDFAGSGAVHLTGGTTALLATWILGPRTGRFYDTAGNPLAEPKDIPGHSIAFQAIGTLVLWFGCKFLDLCLTIS